MTTTTRTPKAPAGALCVVTINHCLSLAMPVDKGLALIRLLSGVMEVDRSFGHPTRIEFESRGRAMEAELVTISADQIVVRTAPERPATDVVDTLPRRLK